MSLTDINFVEEFCQVLEANGDVFFAVDGGEADRKAITAVVKLQGYWAGDSLRYFFDMDLLEKGIVKLLKTEERSFGK